MLEHCGRDFLRRERTFIVRVVLAISMRAGGARRSSEGHSAALLRTSLIVTRYRNTSRLYQCSVTLIPLHKSEPHAKTPL